MMECIVRVKVNGSCDAFLGYRKKIIFEICTKYIV